MEKQQLTELFTVSLTRSEKELLAKLAFERGGTMSGVLRKLIRDTASRDPNQLKEERHATATTIR